MPSPFGVAVVAVVRAKINTIPDEHGGEVAQQVNFAINGDLTKAFARRHGVQISEAGAAATLENAELAQRAKAFSAVVMCQPR